MPQSQTLKIESWSLDRIRPYEQNPRMIPDAAIAKVAASITAFGWRQLIVVDDDGVILAGHTRYQAAMRLGLERVPVHVASGLSLEAARAYACNPLQHWWPICVRSPEIPFEIAPRPPG
jgi:ParB-like chromosome segregation protein Spo0J